MGIVPAGLVVLNIIKMPIKLAFQNLFDATFLDLLEKTGKFVTGLELFKEIVVK